MKLVKKSFMFVYIGKPSGVSALSTYHMQVRFCTVQ